MHLVALLFAFISVSVALPNQEFEDAEVQNMITVPPNCPAGQEWVNGQCRDIWTWRNNANLADLGAIDPSIWLKFRNVITVPTNCPPGQEFINGACRDVWRHFAPTTPLPKNYQNSELEQRDRRQVDSEVNVVQMLEIPDTLINRNIISIPNQCPTGYKPDAFGYCRPILN